MRTTKSPQAKDPIQPFVPVSSKDSTELYSHMELRALTNADPRNELDELSEPQRFRKDVKKPEEALASATEPVRNSAGGAGAGRGGTEATPPQGLDALKPI